MLYSANIKKAMNVAYQAHHGQFDKNGYPYIAHPLHVAERMINETSTIVALLHDVVEDTDVTLDDLYNLGFDNNVIDAIKLLTHDNSLPYMDYVHKIKYNPVARSVKIADLQHNLNSTRLKDSNKPSKKMNTYQQALRFLKS